MKDEVRPLLRPRFPSSLAKFAFVAMLTDSPMYLLEFILNVEFLFGKRRALKVTGYRQQGVTQLQYSAQAF
jgi:hypothetical protein